MKGIFTIILSAFLFVSISAQSNITIDSVFQTGVCDTVRVVVMFTHPSGNNGILGIGGTNYTIQLTNVLDAFTNDAPVTIGVSPAYPALLLGGGVNQKVVYAEILTGMPIGVYQTRIISDSPKDTSDVSGFLVFTSTSFVDDLQSIQVKCFNDTTVLVAPESETYLWSNNETTQSITVTNPGQYIVSTTNSDLLNCAVKDTVKIESNPIYTICIENDSILLVSTIALAETYKWKNDTIIGRDSIMMVFDNDIYTLRTTGPYSCSAIELNTTICDSYKDSLIIAEEMEHTDSIIAFESAHIEEKFEFNIFPNPTSNILNISTKAIIAKLDIRITNSYGQIMFTTTDINLTPTVEYFRTLSLQGLPKGYYNIEFFSETESTSQKLIILELDYE